MCIAQLLSPADMVDVGAGLTHEEGGLFSIVISACMNEVAEGKKKQKQQVFLLWCLWIWSEGSLQSVAIYSSREGLDMACGSCSST